MTETPTEVMEPTVVPQDEPLSFDDYWGTEETQRWYFPDNRQYMVVKVMNEGDRTKYERTTSQDITVERQTQNTHIKMDLAKDRHGLIKAAVCDWNLYRKDRHSGQMVQVPFQGNAPNGLDGWLQHADPRLVDELSLFIRKVNPWLFGEMTIEQIDEDIDRLQKVREDLVRREQGKESSTIR